MTHHARHTNDGFTLLEVIVSLVLLALLMSLIPSALKLARRGPDIAVELDRRAGLDAAMGFVAQRLSEVTPYYLRGDDGRLQIQFEGQPDRLSFIAPIRFDGANNGLSRIELFIGADAQGNDGLIMKWQAVQLGTAVPDLLERSPKASGAKSRVLASHARSFDLRYFGRLPDQDNADWTGTWPSSSELPEQVEFTVVSPAGTRVRATLLRLRLP